MALIVSAGQYVKATIEITNTGTLAYSFRVKGYVNCHGITYLSKDQTFYNASGYNPQNPPPANADHVDASTVSSGASVQVDMYTNMWADGQPFKCASDKMFDTYFEVEIIETAAKFTFQEENVLQHQQTVASQPTVQSSFSIV